MRFHRGRRTLAALALLFGAMQMFTVSTAFSLGEGPIGIWPASERHVLLADTSLPGLVLVDLKSGTTVERLAVPDERPIGVSSCESCNFILITGSKRENPGRRYAIWLLQLPDSTSNLLERQGKLGLSDGTLKKLQYVNTDGPLTDARINLVSPDGKYGYFATSNDRAVYRIDFSPTPTFSKLFEEHSVKPFGLNWGKDGNLLVTMHKKRIWRMTAEGELLNTHNLAEAKCPGIDRHKANLRASLDHPLQEDSLLVLASIPKSYDALIWELDYGSKPVKCRVFTGSIGQDSGWVDGIGSDADFSRPHYMVFRPGKYPHHIIVSDIDNRALRIVDAETADTFSIMYDRDRRLREIGTGALRSLAGCEQFGWRTRNITIDSRIHTFCIQPDRTDLQQHTLLEAIGHCHALKARLCEPYELRSTGSRSSSGFWTGAPCASCWKRTAEDRCPGNIQTFKTDGLVHSDPDFRQSWNTGQGVEVYSHDARESVTQCRPNVEEHAAATLCCADP